MEIKIPEFIFNVNGWVALYITSTLFNILFYGICRCGKPIPRGILISFLPFPLPMILISFDKINDWVYTEH